MIRVSEEEDQGLDNEIPRLYQHHSVLSRISYSWTEPLLAKARRGTLTSADFGDVPAWCGTERVTARLTHFLREKGPGNSGWIKTILCSFRRDILRSTVSSCASDVLMWLQPVLLSRFLRGLSALQGAEATAQIPTSLWVYPLVMTLSMVLRLLAINDCLGKISAVGYMCRSGIMGCLYRKSLRLSNESRQKYSGGKGLNTLTGDTNRISSTITLVNFALIIPIRVVVALTFGYYYLGLYAIPGILFIIVIIGLLLILIRALKGYRESLAQATDERLGLAQEAFQNIKIAKFLGIESPLGKKVEVARDRELGLLFKTNSLLALATGIDFWAPIFAATLSVSWMASRESTGLNTDAIFAFIQAFSTLTVPLMALPMLGGASAAAKVAVERLNEFLSAPEQSSPIAPLAGGASDREHVVSLSTASFKWDSANIGETDLPPAKAWRTRRLANLLCRRSCEDKGPGMMQASSDAGREEPFCLVAINLEITRGSLVGIAGASGAGKTSLFSAILGEMPLERGGANVSGNISYAQQTAWLMGGTVRDNILFGHPYDPQRYNECIVQCRLVQDLKTFPDGDATIIGERGSTISGGQRQRINLARAVYARADIYLLDDPTSALDAQVGRLIFDECIMGGLLAGSTRVIATHQVRILSKCDRVIRLKDGAIIWDGKGKDFSAQDLDGETEAQDLKGGMEAPLKADLDGPVSLVTEFSIDDEGLLKDKLWSQQDDGEGVARNAGIVAGLAYLGAFGGLAAIAGLMVLAFTLEIIKITRDGLLKDYLNGKGAVVLDSMTFATRYALMGTAQGIALGLLTVVTVFLCRRASRLLHRESLGRLLSGELLFFEETPLGQILGRFTGDLMAIDENFPERITQALFCLSSLVSLILLIGFYYPGVIPSLPVPILATILLQQRFRRAWRQLQQLCSITLVPVISHFSETLSGLTLIRVFRREAEYIATFDRANDKYCYAAIWLMSVRRWASLRCEAVWIFYWLVLAYYCVYFRVMKEAAGLLLSYVNHTIESVDWAMRHLAEIESCFVSVERLNQYSLKVKPEAVGESSSSQLLEGWPVRGHVIFENVSIQYKTCTAATISDFSFDFSVGKKIAVVGRSGAGKSTLVSALFRFVECSKGRIMIDGIDIRTISLKRLRDSIAMVPQDPFLFTGTIRFNLDPHSKYSDAQIWSALEIVQMRDVINKHSRKLELDIKHNVSELSVGQRQAICLARALLKGSRIIVMDEATSNLDTETEALIRGSWLSGVLQETTVISIAHRLETIMDYDEVLVMSQGRIIEHGNPRKLAQARKEFAKMLQSASISVKSDIIE